MNTRQLFFKIALLCSPAGVIQAELPRAALSRGISSRCAGNYVECATDIDGFAAVRASARDTVVAHVGNRIRFRLSGGNELIVAALTAVTTDSVGYRSYCTGCGPTMTSRAALMDLEVGRSVRSPLRTGVGTVVGAAVVASVWFVIAALVIPDYCHDGPCGAAAIILIPEAAGLGAIVGGLIGWHSKREQWSPAVLPPQ